MNSCSVIMSYYTTGAAALTTRVCADILDNAQVNPTLRWVVVDDCSPLPFPQFSHPNLIVARIDQDIPHNATGGRNLAIHLASTDWVIGFDLDHHAPPELFTMLLDMPVNDDTMYQLCCDRGRGFRADAISASDNYAPNLFMARRDRLLAIGGYDEDFAGHYGSGDRWLQNCWRNAGLRFAVTTQYPVEETGARGPEANATPTYTGLPRDLETNRALLARKRAGELPMRHGLRFTWQVRS